MGDPSSGVLPWAENLVGLVASLGQSRNQQPFLPLCYQTVPSRAVPRPWILHRARPWGWALQTPLVLAPSKSCVGEIRAVPLSGPGWRQNCQSTLIQSQSFALSQTLLDKLHVYVHVYPRAVAPRSSCRSPTTCQSNRKVFDCWASSACGCHSPLRYIFWNWAVACGFRVG